MPHMETSVRRLAAPLVVCLALATAIAGSAGAAAQAEPTSSIVDERTSVSANAGGANCVAAAFVYYLAVAFHDAARASYINAQVKSCIARTDLSRSQCLLVIYYRNDF